MIMQYDDASFLTLQTKDSFKIISNSRQTVFLDTCLRLTQVHLVQFFCQIVQSVGSSVSCDSARLTPVP